jgi:hypothetical protein
MLVELDPNERELGPRGKLDHDSRLLDDNMYIEITAA